MVVWVIFVRISHIKKLKWTNLWNIDGLIHKAIANMADWGLLGIEVQPSRLKGQRLRSTVLRGEE